MIYNNISFDGCHCLDHMGLIYVPDRPEKIICPQAVYSYTVGGVPGTAAYGDQHVMEPYNLSGTFYPAMDIADEAEARRLWRKTAQWLGVGRRKLVQDSEPDKYIIAEIQEMDNDEYGWIDGGLHVIWLCQPYRWVLYPDELSLTVGGAVSSDWYVETSLPAPVDVNIVNSGTSMVNRVTVVVGGKKIAFEDLQLLPGEQLQVSMMTPIGAVVVAEDGTQRSAMESMTGFEQLLANGKVSISCELDFAEDGGSALLRLMGQGCWR